MKGVVRTDEPTELLGFVELYIDFQLIVQLSGCKYAVVIGSHYS